LLSQEPLQTYH